MLRWCVGDSVLHFEDHGNESLWAQRKRHNRGFAARHEISGMTSSDRREIAFLKQCLRYGESAERIRLEEKINQIQLDQRCVLRGVSLMALLIVLALIGLWSAENFSENNFEFMVKVFGAMGLGAAISLVGFLGVWVCYREELCRRQEECRSLVMAILESRRGSPGQMPVISTERVTLETSRDVVLNTAMGEMRHPLDSGVGKAE